MAGQLAQSPIRSAHAVTKPSAWMLSLCAVLAWVPVIQIAAWQLGWAKSPAWLIVSPLHWWVALAVATVLAVLLATRQR